MNPFPRAAEIKGALPKGRRPYIEAAIELDNKDLMGSSHGKTSVFALRRAIHALADAHTAGELEPPLPGYIAPFIVDMSLAMREAEDKVRQTRPGVSELIREKGANVLKHTPHAREAAELAIRTALDHSYRA